MRRKRKEASKYGARTIGELLAQQTEAIRYASEPEGRGWDAPRDLPSKQESRQDESAQMPVAVDQHLRRLIDAHPLIFRSKSPAVPSYISTGWYRLVDTLCSDIESILEPGGCARLEVRQIKEKFGALRFYYSLDGRSNLHIDVASANSRMRFVGRSSQGSDDLTLKEARVRELVTAACAASESLCETCGAPAQLRNLGGWLTTLCDRHLAEARANRPVEEGSSKQAGGGDAGGVG